MPGGGTQKEEGRAEKKLYNSPSPKWKSEHKDKKNLKESHKKKRRGSSFAPFAHLIGSKGQKKENKKKRARETKEEKKHRRRINPMIENEGEGEINADERKGGGVRVV